MHKQICKNHSIKYGLLCFFEGNWLTEQYAGFENIVPTHITIERFTLKSKIKLQCNNEIDHNWNFNIILKKWFKFCFCFPFIFVLLTHLFSLGRTVKSRTYSMDRSTSTHIVLTF